MKTESVSLVDLSPEVLAEALSTLEKGETIDQLVENLLSRFNECRDVETAVEREWIGRAVARAFRKR